MNGERTLSELRQITRTNRANRVENEYEGLTQKEIRKLDRAIMFGENDCAFPSQEEWSAIVD